MADKFLWRINDDYALMYDPLQYVIAKRKRAKPRSVSRDWRPLAFIRTGREDLKRHLRSRRIDPDAKGAAQITALPDSFETFLADREPS